MTTFMMKLQLALSLILAASVSYSYGDYNNSSCSESLCCDPCPCECGKVYFGAELLYWRAYERGLDDCVPSFASDTVLPDGRIISAFSGKGKDPRFNWDPGFRVGLGYQFANSNWDVGAFWTHFNSHAKSSRDLANTLRLNIDLDVVDLVTAYQYDLNPCFSLVPFLGVRGARIDQTVHAGDPDLTTFAAAFDENLVGVHNKQRFLGVGPLFGLEADLLIGSGFSIYARGSVAWLYGHTDVTLTNSLATVDVIDYSHIKNKFDSFLTAGDAAFGLRWETCFCSDKILSLTLGFEHHTYFDYNHICDHGDLSFDGVEFGVGVQF